MMQEETLLDRTLEILDASGPAAALKWLEANRSAAENCTGQTYNFLACLSAGSGETEKALSYLEQAVLEKGFWYRSDVWEDGDFDPIRQDPRFLLVVQKSESAYQAALKTAATRCSWKETEGTRLALALHGNQQNAAIAEAGWRFLRGLGYQTETVQSAALDSAGLYRWEDRAAAQLPDVFEKIQWRAYDERLLCGFSAGCGEILRALVSADFPCERVVLHSPWIPQFAAAPGKVLEALKTRGTRLLLCGEQDADCLPLADKLEEAAKGAGLAVTAYRIPGLGHALSPELAHILEDWLRL